MSYNPRIEWLERNIDDGKLVPKPTAMDEGKVPTVDSHGEYVLETPPKELPQFTSADEGKVLEITVDDNVASAEWVTPEKELPAFSGSDDGKVLTVDGSGATPELVWGEGGGGSDLPEYSSGDKGKVLTIAEKFDTEYIVPEQTVTFADYGDKSTLMAAPISVPAFTYEGDSVLNIGSDSINGSTVGDYAFTSVEFNVAYQTLDGQLGWYIVDLMGSYSIGDSATVSVSYEENAGVVPSWQTPSGVDGLQLVNFDETTGKLDKTWDEINYGLENGKMFAILDHPTPTSTGIVLITMTEEFTDLIQSISYYNVYLNFDQNTPTFRCNTASDYPELYIPNNP